MDFLDELNELALGSRLKRLSEQFVSQASEIYQYFGIDIQPKWFTLLALLHKRKQLTVVEAAESLGLSQPAISQFCQQLAKQKLIDFVVCEKDARRRLITLSETGKNSVEKMQPIWAAVQHAAKEISQAQNNNLLLAIQKCEQALRHQSLKQRTIEAFNEQQ